jgi:hypothetical protein
MQALLLIGVAVVLCAVVMVVSWLRWKWSAEGDAQYMSDQWMKDHVYRTGVTKGDEL